MKFLYFSIPLLIENSINQNDEQYIDEHYNDEQEIVYAPQNEFIDSIMSHMKDELSLFTTVTAVNDSITLENKMKSGKCFVGIEFPDEYKVSKFVQAKRANMYFN